MNTKKWLLFLLSSLVLVACGGSPTPTSQVPVEISVIGADGSGVKPDGTVLVVNGDEFAIYCKAPSKKCQWTLETDKASVTSKSSEGSFLGVVVAGTEQGRLVVTAYSPGYTKKAVTFNVKSGG